MTPIIHYAILYVKLTLHYLQGSDFLKNRIEELRQEKGLTQLDLANILKVSRQTVNSLEKGKYNPSITLAFKISKFFGMKIENIFLFEE